MAKQVVSIMTRRFIIRCRCEKCGKLSFVTASIKTEGTSQSYSALSFESTKQARRDEAQSHSRRLEETEIRFLRGSVTKAIGYEAKLDPHCALCKASQSWVCTILSAIEFRKKWNDVAMKVFGIAGCGALLLWYFSIHGPLPLFILPVLFLIGVMVNTSRNTSAAIRDLDAQFARFPAEDRPMALFDQSELDALIQQINAEK